MFYIQFIPLFFSIIGIGFLITIHELGHFLFCKLFKISAPKFAIGIGPKIFEKKIGETDFSIGIIPIAGYVQIGEENQQQDLSVLNKSKYYKGFLVLMGGIIFNTLFAYLAIIGVISFEIKNDSTIKPFICNTKIKNLCETKDYLKENDIITKCNNNEVDCPYDIYKNINECKEKNKNITVGLYREGKFEEIILNNDIKLTKNFFNDFESNDKKNNSFFNIIKCGIKTTNNLIKLTINGIISLFKKKETKNISGCLGIIQGISIAFQNGFSEFIIILAMVSISLAVMNILPLPVLDGGQLVMLTISKIIGRDLSETIQMGLTYFSFFIVALLILLSTYNDILRFISLK